MSSSSLHIRQHESAAPSAGRRCFRVCHIASGDVWGGLEAVVLSLLEAQQAHPDFAVTLIVLNEGRLAREARSLGVQVRLVAESSVGVLRMYGELKRVLLEIQPDILHTHRYKENFFAYLLGPRLGLSHVVTFHGLEPSHDRLVRLKVNIREAILRRMARRAGTRFAAVSRDLQRAYRVPERLCTIIPNGIRVPPAEPTAARRPEHSPPVIGWIGRMVPIKSVHTLLDAVALLSDLPEKPLVLLVGDGPERAALEEQATRLGIRDRVEFTGFVTDLTPHIARMSLFVLPSLHEGVPIALLEAMGAGVPVIAARVGGIPEMIGDSAAARLVGSHSPADWAAEIRAVTTTPGIAREMARRGRELVASRFSLETMLDRYTELYGAATG